jgi:hypothetical protein
MQHLHIVARSTLVGTTCPRDLWQQRASHSLRSTLLSSAACPPPALRTLACRMSMSTASQTNVHAVHDSSMPAVRSPASCATCEAEGCRHLLLAYSWQGSGGSDLSSPAVHACRQAWYRCTAEASRTPQLMKHAHFANLPPLHGLPCRRCCSARRPYRQCACRQEGDTARIPTAQTHKADVGRCDACSRESAHRTACAAGRGAAEHRVAAVNGMLQ